LRVTLTSATPSSVDVFYQTADEPRFNRKHVQRIPLREGKNDLCIELTDPALAGPMLMRFGESTGSFVLHRLELRAVPR
jgi:hypothetical protein